MPLASALADDDPKPADSKPQPSALPFESETLAFVREHHPELATVLEPLKDANPAEYRKAIGDLSQVARSLADIKGRNPGRYEVLLDSWKAKSRVELIAARLAGSPTEELQSQLRLAIEARVEAEVRRQRFDLEQAEAAAKKARANLDRLEKNRSAIVENRYRALLPKKTAKSKKPADPKPKTSTSTSPSTGDKKKPGTPANPKPTPNPEDRG